MAPKSALCKKVLYFNFLKYRTTHTEWTMQKLSVPETTWKKGIYITINTTVEGLFYS